MPVTSTVTQAYVISGVAVDMATPALTVSFSRTINGADVGGPSLHLEGAAFAAVFNAPADGTKTRADDLSIALYNAAVAAGIISGAVS